METATIIASGDSLRGYEGPFTGHRLFINHSWKYFDFGSGDLDRLICYDKISHREDQGYNSWPYIHTRQKNGGRFRLVGSEFQTEYPKVGNWNTTIAFAINIAWHWGYRKLYLLGVDGVCGEYFHFYDDKPLNVREQAKQNKMLNGRDGGIGVNQKILKAVHGFEENGGEVIFVESQIQDGITLKEYEACKG